MPQLADITVKKHDGTTDIVYVGQSPSGGDSSPAVWKATSVGTAPAHHPELRLVSRDAQKGAKRTLRSTFQYPQIATNSVTGLTTVVDRASASTDWTFPKEMSQDDIDEFVFQYANLLVSTLIKGCVVAGYSAT